MDEVIESSCGSELRNVSPSVIQLTRLSFSFYSPATPYALSLLKEGLAE